jgi:hypothetical protein
MNEKILEILNQPSINTYLNFLQSNISRMNSNSNNIKILIATIYAFLIAINKIDDIKIFLTFIIMLFIGFILDTYYLAIEKIYRKKFNNFIENINNENFNIKDIFDMKPKNTPLKYEIFAEMVDTFFSFSIWIYYLLFIIITVLLKFL